MKKLIKVSGIVLLSLILLITVTAVLLTFLVNPNKFKGKISQLVFAKTGQVLAINGDVHWSIFPWIGIRANNLTYYNPAGFQPKVFASAKEMDVKIKLMPLLQHQIEVGNITFDHLVLNLVKNKAGKNNWEALNKNNDKSETDKPSNDHGASFSKLVISSFKIKDGTVNWVDLSSNQKYSLNNFNLNSKGIAEKHGFPLATSFTVLDANSQPLADINLNTKLTFNTQNKQYLLQNLKLSGYLFDKKYVNGKIAFNTNADMNIDLQKQLLSSQTEFALDNLKGTAIINGRQIVKNAMFNGDVKIKSFDINSLLTTLGHADNPIKNLAIETHVNYANSSIKLDQLSLRTDDADISGRANIQLKNKFADFNLASTEIDLNKFLSNKADTKADATANNEANQVSATGTPKPSDNNWRVHGNVRIGKLSVKKLQLTNVTSTVTYQNDILELAPIHADLYRGETNGSVTIDKRNTEKTFYTIKQFINNVDLKEMLQQVADSEKLSGTANITANLTSITTPQTSFMAGLNGSLQLLIKNGTLQGVDVTYQISRAHSFIKHFEKTQVEDTKETQFQELTASAQITNGVLENKDLIISSDYLKVNGQGSLNFNENAISYYLKALARPKLAQDNQLEKEIITYEIPIKVTGNLSKPSVNLDFAQLTKIVFQRQIKKPLQDQVEKNIQNLKDNLKDKIKDKLPNIFDKL